MKFSFTFIDQIFHLVFLFFFFIHTYTNSCFIFLPFFIHHHRDFIFFIILFRFFYQSNSEKRIERNSINYKLTMDWIFFYSKKLAIQWMSAILYYVLAINSFVEWLVEFFHKFFLHLLWNRGRKTFRCFFFNDCSNPRSWEEEKWRTNHSWRILTFTRIMRFVWKIKSMKFSFLLFFELAIKINC